jgi:hypothetical protein
MSKMREDELERRIANGARIIDEYQPTFNPSWSVRSAQSEIAHQDEHYISPSMLADFKVWAAEVNRQCEERYSHEQVVVFDLTQRDINVLVLRDAVEKFGWEAGHLDDTYAGLTHQNGHILISERMASYCLQKYAPEELLAGARAEKARIMDEAWAGIPHA